MDMTDIERARSGIATLIHYGKHEEAWALCGFVDEAQAQRRRADAGSTAHGSCAVDALSSMADAILRNDHEAADRHEAEAAQCIGVSVERFRQLMRQAARDYRAP